MDGVLVIDKPKDMTSHDVIDVVRRASRTRSVGHAGTLDPMATGVLVVAMGKATKLIRFMKTDPKEYHARIAFGLETDTDDIDGSVTLEKDASHLKQEVVERALSKFKGKIEQVPPAYSAVKVKGVPSYRLARKGAAVELKPRTVEVYELELLSFKPGERAEAELSVKCSAGTYVRSLARDLGRELGTGGTMLSLRRVRSGAFSIEHAVTPCALSDHEAILTRIIPVEKALGNLPSIRLRAGMSDRVKNGQPVTVKAVSECDEAEKGSIVKVLNGSGQILAIATATVRLDGIESMGKNEIVAKPVRVV